MPVVTDLFDDCLVVSPLRPPTPMTRRPIAQIASTGNLKPQEKRRLAAVFLQNRLLHPRRLASRLNRFHDSSRTTPELGDSRPAGRADLAQPRRSRAVAVVAR